MRLAPSLSLDLFIVSGASGKGCRRACVSERVRVCVEERKREREAARDSEAHRRRTRCM